jgi:hypothetical protein
MRAGLAEAWRWRVAGHWHAGESRGAESSLSQRRNAEAQPKVYLASGRYCETHEIQMHGATPLAAGAPLAERPQPADALLRAAARPLPGPVSSARVCAPPSFACDHHRKLGGSWFFAVTSRAHASARCLRPRLGDGMSAARSCLCALNVAIDVCLALTRRLEAPCAAENGANSSTGQSAATVGTCVAS